MKSQNHFQFEHEKSKRPVTKVPRYKVKYTKEKVKQISQEIPEEIPAKLAQTTIQDMPATTVQPSTYTPLTVQIPNPIVAPQPRLQITGGVPQTQQPRLQITGANRPQLPRLQITGGVSQTQQPRLQITGANRPQLPRLQITDGRLYPTVEPWEDVEIPYQRMYPTVEPYSPGEMPSQRMYPTVEPYTPLKVEVLPTPTNPIVSPDRAMDQVSPVSSNGSFGSSIYGPVLDQVSVLELLANAPEPPKDLGPEEIKNILDSAPELPTYIEDKIKNMKKLMKGWTDYSLKEKQSLRQYLYNLALEVRKNALEKSLEARRLNMIPLTEPPLEPKTSKRVTKKQKGKATIDPKAQEEMRQLATRMPAPPAPAAILSQRRRRNPGLRIDTSAPIVSNMGQGSPETPPYAPTTPASRNRIPLRINTTLPKVPRRGRQSPKTPPSPPTTPSFPFEQPWILAEPNRRFNTSDVSTANVVVGPRRRKQRK